MPSNKWATLPGSSRAPGATLATRPPGRGGPIHDPPQRSLRYKRTLSNFVVQHDSLAIASGTAPAVGSRSTMPRRFPALKAPPGSSDFRASGADSPVEFPLNQTRDCDRVHAGRWRRDAVLRRASNLRQWKCRWQPLPGRAVVYRWLRTIARTNPSRPLLRSEVRCPEDRKPWGRRLR